MIGRFSRSETDSLPACWPARVKSINSPSIGIWLTRIPSLKTSTACAKLCIDIPAAASLAGSGDSWICGVPVFKLGRTLIWLPSRRGKARLNAPFSAVATVPIFSCDAPVTSRLIEREPPTERPNSEAWRTKARAPGSAKTGRVRTDFNSFTRPGSAEEAPAKAPPAKATKKKREISGGPSSVVCPSHKGRAVSSIFPAMRLVSSIE